MIEILRHKRASQPKSQQGHKAGIKKEKIPLNGGIFFDYLLIRPAKCFTVRTSWLT
jgi:hypothetical protein